MTSRRLLIASLALALALGVDGCEDADPPAAAAGPAARSDSESRPISFAPIVRRVTPAVVSIDTLAAEGVTSGWRTELPQGVVPGLGPGPVRRGAASGFIVSPDGYIVTNNHVVAGAQQIVVTLSDNRQFDAKLVGRDPPTDLAVLKIDGRGLPFVSFARSALPAVGDWVVAVGNPFGLGGTATAGIVSAQSRDLGEAYVSFIQIDAPINAGNSGGPSFDLQGRVVGVNTAIFSPNGGSVGIGFAIPAQLAQAVANQLIRHGAVIRAYVGIAVQDLTPAIAAQLGLAGQRGALVVDVPSASPAQGVLLPGDVITQIGGAKVASAGALTRQIAEAKPGDAVDLRILRRGESLEVHVRASRRPENLAS